MLLGMSSHVIVIGGGPAGLQAALTVARVGRSVTVLDSQRYRNASATHLHNYAGWDGTPPPELRRQARRDLDGYPHVTVLDRTATSVRADGDGFVVEADGPLEAGTVVLATGLADELPDVPGLAELWGTGVAHCPFCHGYELRGHDVAVLADGPQGRHVAGLMAPLARRVVVVGDGGDLPGPDDVEGPVVRLERTADGVRVVLAGGRTLDVGGVFVSPRLVQRAPFAAQLGLSVLPSGCVEVDDLQRTSRPGVLAAGDMAHRPSLPMPMASVLTAAASGLVAGASAVARLLERSSGAALVAGGQRGR